MSLRRKSRSLPFEIEAAGFQVRNPTIPLTSNASTPGIVVNGSQITDSEGHRRPKGRSRIADGDIGGDFFTEKKTVVGNTKPVSFNFSNPLPILTIFDGSVQWFPLTPTAALFPPSARSSDDELGELGATAISRCKPTKSTASFATALGELRKDGLPKILGAQTWQNRTDSLRKNAGGEFLNLEFGWQPLLHDVRSLAAGVLEMDKLASQYIRDAGRPVRRDYRFPTIKSVSDPVLAGTNVEHVQPFNSRFWDGTIAQKTYYIDYTEKQQWFEGVFSYAIPPATKKLLGKHVSSAAEVLGVVPTPEVLWNLAPWSWAFDWFSNTGDVVSNASDWAVDGLVMRYGYIMERSIVKRTYYTDESNFKPGLGSVAPDLTFITETKIRRRANPFGFGVSWNGLSPVQIAIAAALGLSRGL